LFLVHCVADRHRRSEHLTELAVLGGHVLAADAELSCCALEWTHQEVLLDHWAQSSDSHSLQLHLLRSAQVHWRNQRQLATLRSALVSFFVAVFWFALLSSLLGCCISQLHKVLNARDGIRFHSSLLEQRFWVIFPVVRVADQPPKHGQPFCAERRLQVLRGVVLARRSQQSNRQQHIFRHWHHHLAP